MSKRQMVAVVTDATCEVLVEHERTGGSNNIAELWAVERALDWCVQNDIHDVEIRTDSRNNVAWISGRVGNGVNDRTTVERLQSSILSARQRVRLNLTWIPRTENIAGHYIEARFGL